MGPSVYYVPEIFQKNVRVHITRLEMLVFRKILCWTMSHHMQLKKNNNKKQNKTKSRLRFSVDSNPARGVPEICNGANLCQWSRLEMRLTYHLSSVNNSGNIIHHHHHLNKHQLHHSPNISNYSFRNQK